MPTTRRSSGLHGSQKTPSTQKILSFSNSSKISKANTPSSLKNKSPLSQTLPLKEQPSKGPTSAFPSPPASSPHLPTKSVPKPKPKTKTPLETQQRTLASQITDAKIRKYWKEREALRLARRVHQGGLEIGEKVLREWDCMSQFGPSIGIPRTQRWYRACKLGLNPPIEVLAVLLKEEEKKNATMERSYMDELMN